MGLVWTTTVVEGKRRLRGTRNTLLLEEETPIRDPRDPVPTKTVDTETLGRGSRAEKKKTLYEPSSQKKKI